MDEGDPTRRNLLAGASGIAASALAGCSERLWTRAENTAPEQVELTIKTVPADDDAAAAKIMSHLRENYQAAGIDATHEPIAKAELYRDILLEGDYDVFVVRHPGFDEYDALFELLHSQFVSGRGWQNPFHYSDVTADEHLESQRTSRGDRHNAMAELVEYLEETAPYTVVVFPHHIGAVSADIPITSSPREPLEFYRILSTETENGPRDGPLEVGVFGEGLTERLNPIIVDRNRIDGLLGLLYDPLVRRRSGESIPWLASDVTWEESGRTSATITLRDGLSWHDGTDIDADDVVFTYRFIQDTSMGDIDGGLPAPRYRGRQTIAENVTRVDSRTVRFSFGNTVRSASTRSLTIPILPEHIWEPRSEVIAQRQTEALVVEDEELIGSGPFELGEVTDTAIQLVPFDEHVFRDSSSDRPFVLDGFSQYSGIRFRIDPNPGAMIDAILDGEIDLTATTIPPGETAPIVAHDEIRLTSVQTDSFYMIGYNVHHSELGNPRFRRVLSRLIDREYTVSELFDGFAQPANSFSSLVGIRDDRWEHRTDPILPQFPGTDGEIDVEQVRTLFEDAGYQYENGSLLE
ncbi:ABC transporter substrate-binding protein [Natrarchaeobius chitinivorans]|uniref:ABC transporter substrate-binding protein n=1 Tax=Natrarchaeobius chitinivorans TaxID=1679083 RepID=A0A3N6M106_NATCH|nr:ABC transporter substrate-binding protein [Natrarchaeobius chitinivorans]RQG96983.1 ABC transporter substrate-binding protein [Natrarchaeobius chitinivorans]